MKRSTGIRRNACVGGDLSEKADWPILNRAVRLTEISVRLGAFVADFAHHLKGRCGHRNERARVADPEDGMIWRGWILSRGVLRPAPVPEGQGGQGG